MSSQQALFEGEAAGKVTPCSAGTLVGEREGVLVYQRRVQWTDAETGQTTTLKKPHYIGLCETCLIDSCELTPDGIEAAVRAAHRYCPQFCDREHCALANKEQ